MDIEINLPIFLTTLSRSTNTLSRQAPLPNYADVGVIVIVLKGVSKSFSGVLVALIRVVYFRFAAIVYRVFQSIDTKTPSILFDSRQLSIRRLNPLKITAR